MKLRKRTARIGKQKIRYLCGGKGKTLVFLHGWSTNPLAHSEGLELLSGNFTVYAPFLFDMNFTSLNQLSSSVCDFIEQLGTEKVVLAGTSFGGVIAAMIAVRKPKLVSKLVLVNTAGIPSKASLLVMAADSLRSFLMLIAERRISVLVHRWLSGIKFHLTFWRHGMLTLSAQLRNKSAIGSVFRKIRVKTVVVWSTDDVTYPVTFARKIHRSIKNSALVIVKGTHAWQYHSPAMFAMLLAKYAA